MTKLRSIAVAVVSVALLSGVAHAQGAVATDGSWSSKYGMLFNVQNVFGNNNASTLSDFGGSVGLQYNLAPQRAIRLQVGLSRASNSGTENETTTTSGTTSVTTKTYTRPTGFTSFYDVDLAATYMMRLTPAALSPYLGAGAKLGYSQTALKYTDDINDPLNTFERDDLARTYSLGGQGVLGLEWRVHKSVALFAEYALDLTLVNRTSTRLQSSNTPKTGLASSSKSEGTKTTFFNFNTELGQGGLIGLVAFF